MKKARFSTMVKLFGAAIVMMSISSCNRGYGCPSNFSLESSIGDVISVLATFFIG